MSRSEPDPTAEPVTRPAPAALLGECGFCHGKIIWLTLSNGSRRTFEPCEFLTSTMHSAVIEQRGFGLRPGHIATPLSCVSRWPRWMLLSHLCSAYLQARDEKRYGVSRLSDIDIDLRVRPVQPRRGARASRRDNPVS